MNSAKQFTGYAEVDLDDIKKALSRHRLVKEQAKAWTLSQGALEQAQERFYKFSGWAFMKKYTCPQKFWENYCKKKDLSPSQQQHLREQNLGEIPERFTDVLYWCNWGGLDNQWGDVPKELAHLANASGCQLILLSPRACHFVGIFKESPYHETH